MAEAYYKQISSYFAEHTDVKLTSGEICYEAVDAEEPAGKHIVLARKVSCRLRLNDVETDLEVLVQLRSGRSQTNSMWGPISSDQYMLEYRAPQKSLQRMLNNHSNRDWTLIPIRVFLRWKIIIANHNTHLVFGCKSELDRNIAIVVVMGTLKMESVGCIKHQGWIIEGNGRVIISNAPVEQGIRGHPRDFKQLTVSMHVRCQHKYIQDCVGCAALAFEFIFNIPVRFGNTGESGWDLNIRV